MVSNCVTVELEMRAVFLASVLAASACGQDNTEAVLAYHSFLRQVASIHCEALLKCCQNPPYPDLNTCTEALVAALGTPRIEDETLRSNEVLFDQSQTEACIQTLQGAVVSCNNPVDAVVVRAYSCPNAFVGTLAEGARCGLLAANVACVSGATCSATRPDPSQPSVGTCVAAPARPPLAPEGQSCGVDALCLSYHCSGGNCVAPLSLTQFLCNK